jgi:outer membrane protein assembly factor BamD (BamD/ComL family)
MTARGPNGPPGSSFYFYNSSTVAYGKNEFKKNWGDRELEDDWRWSLKSKSIVSESAKSEETVVVAANELFDPKYYIDRIPTDQKVIDSLIKERNFAYYQLAVIYKEKFKEYELSKDTFQYLLSLNPEQKLVLPSKYNLYKLYTLLGENDEANIAKNDIITNYPDSRYASILLNPEAGATKDENSPDFIYKAIYDKLENQEYSEVISQCDKYISAFQGDPIVAKFELLKATATGRLYGFEAYSNALNFVALNYANTPEGMRAQDISDNVLPKLASKEFVDNEAEDNYKIVYYFTNTKEEDIKKFIEKLEKETEKVNIYDLSISEDIYNPTTTFVIIHGLKSKAGAIGYAHALEEKKKNKIIHDFFAVSSPNYRVIQIHKNFEDYINIE